MMKKVLLIVPSNRGTIAMCSANLYKGLLEANVILKCVVIYKINNGLKCFDKCDFCYDKTVDNTSKKFFLGQLKWLLRIKKEFRPDISISTLNNCSVLNVLTNVNDKKIGIFHAPYTQSRVRGQIFYIGAILSYLFIFSRLDKLFCVSKEVKNVILNKFRTINRKKVHVVYNIHDVQNILLRSNDESLCDKYEHILDSKYFLYCGRLDRNKAPERLLKAYILNKELLKDYNLVYIGDDTDNMLTELREIAKENKVDDKFFFLGRQNNPYLFMRKASALISCSYSEGLPGVLIESLILNTPVVSTNSSEGVWEILECENNFNPNLENLFIAKKGIIVSNDESENKDIQALSKALCLIDDEKFKLPLFSFLEKISANNVVRYFID